MDSEKKRKEDDIQLSVKEMVARFETAGCGSKPETVIGKNRSLGWRSTKNLEVAFTETDDKLINDKIGVEVEERKGSGRAYAPQGGLISWFAPGGGENNYTQNGKLRTTF